MPRSSLSSCHLLRPLSSTCPSSLSSSSPPAWQLSKSGGVWRSLLAACLLVCLAEVARAVDNSVIHFAGVQKQVADGLPPRHDAAAERLNNPSQGRNPESLDGPDSSVGNNNIIINPRSDQAGQHRRMPDLLNTQQNPILDQLGQKPQDQEKAKAAAETKQNDGSKESAAFRQGMEEKERILAERLKQQEQLQQMQQQQGRNDQQNLHDAQREQHRAQQWLAEVHRKSQEALAERQKLSQQQQQQNPQPPAGVNQPLESRDKPLPVIHQNDNQPQNVPAAPANNDIRNNLDSQRNDANSANSNNHPGLDMFAVRETLNGSLQEDHVSRGAAMGNNVDLLNPVNQNKMIQPLPQQDLVPGNKSSNREGPVTDTGNAFNNPGMQNREVNVINPAGGNANPPNLNFNNNGGGWGNGVQKTPMPEHTPNMPGSGNQWAKYEFNNANPNVNPQQQQQQQPQIGGINLSWDWEDFSIMFNSYGAAEMKVRRSPHPTTGEPWPMPQYYSKKDDRIYKVSKDIHFIPTGATCDILEEGLTRHLQRTVRGCVEDMYDNLQNAEGSPIEDPALRYEREEFVKAPLITRVEVKVRKPCEKYPSLESDESYDLVVKKRKTYIWANEIWGALRGLETLGHLVWRGTDGFLYIKETVISDYPRFQHRGLHIDTSRHFLFKEVILDILDSMEMNKLNVFHWHIVDDQSFPYESKVYPELSRKGAFHPTYVYSLEDIAEIIEYARLRGIRVMPEFDTPGHTYAWGLSRPELLTQCYSGSMPVKGYLGPIDPSKNSTYRFLQTLFKEIAEVFKDQYIHLGGDEVPLGCWQSNPEVTAFAQELAKRPRDVAPQQSGQGQFNPNNNIGGSWSMWSDEIRRVYEYYENRLINILNEIGQKRKKGIKYVMWQEVMNNNLQLPNDTIIQVWMGDMADVMRATSLGYQVIYSTCWYLDRIEYGTKWPKYYNCDPVDQSFGFQIDEKKVLGGEAAFWAEYFSNENLIPLMWPRASAAAERLWSSKEVKNLDKAAERLTEHRCRMIKRGINAGEINGPGYCLHSPPRRHLYNDTAGCKGGNCTRTHNFVQIEDFEVHVSQRGGSLADCGNVFSQGNGNVFIVLTLALVVVVALYALSKSSSHFHRMRSCKNRSILLVFVVVLLVYLLCYTTIWMRAFEFSGSFHKTVQEDNRSGSDGNDEDGSNFRPISS